jgi:hypothetical protein
VFCRTDEKHARDWRKSPLELHSITKDALAFAGFDPDNIPEELSGILNYHTRDPDANSETYTNYAKENAKDIIAIGSSTGETFFQVNSSSIAASAFGLLVEMLNVRATLKSFVLIYSHADGSAGWATCMEILGCLLWF